TTRLSSGVLWSRLLNETWFTQNALGFSFPTSPGQINKFDFATGVGFWWYKDPSLEPWYRGPKSRSMILGFVPQFEVLGSFVLGKNQLTGQYGLDNNTAKMAEGTVNNE